MGLNDGPVFPETLYFKVTIDDIPFPYVVEARIRHTVNTARSLTVSFAGQEALDMARLGGIVKVDWGRGNLQNLIDDSQFIGIIKSVSPKETKSTFIALDYTTFLAESQYVQYKPQDYIGEDLYFAAARACDYKGIDITRLTQGSGIMITKDMNLFGWKTRKEFIDACFNEMRVVVNDSNHPKNTLKQWQYAIRTGKKMDFFLPDPKNELLDYVSVTLSEANNNIINEGLISKIDTSKLINAITIVDKNNENIYVQLEDKHSQDNYGVVGEFVTHESANKNDLEQVGYEILNRFKEPTMSYSVSLSNEDNLDLGDNVKIDMVALKKSLIETVIGYEISLSNTVSTRYLIGQPKVTFKEYIDILKEPTDR
jgi:hypothetical protein|tara:strand:- start:180 stop:1286 length:1107 start_codon:yes stop_codon:yes gene_type:complete